MAGDVISKKTKGGITEGTSNGLIKYVVDSYTITNLPVTPGTPLSHPQILALAQSAATVDPVPLLSSLQYGLPVKRWRVKRNPNSRSRATITLQYGSPSGFIVNDDSRRTRTIDFGITITLPYFVDRSVTLPPGLAGPVFSLFEAKEQKGHFVGTYEIWHGELQPTSFNPILTRQISIQNKLKLYTVQGLPFLHTGVDIRDLRGGQYWTWTKYMSSGVRKGFAADDLELGSQAVEPLGVLEQYRLDQTTHTTTVAKPIDLYDVGTPLTWDT
ncbi:MAG: hypothetical protein JKY67_00105 [Pseudomonadales bacterium]|nr:hypothetical protein [Pseudomonadales bacterium]